MENTWDQPKDIQEIEYKRHSNVLRVLEAEDLARISKILEIGCHVGFSTYVFSEEGLIKGKEYLGIDIDEVSVQKAEKKKAEFGWSNVRFMKLSLFDMNRVFAEEFDLVIIEEVLEHLDTLDKALKCIWQVLGLHGLLVLTVPYRETKEQGKRWAHKTYFIDKRKMRETLKKTGFSTERFTILDLTWPPPDASEKVLFARARKVV